MWIEKLNWKYSCLCIIEIIDTIWYNILINMIFLNLHNCNKMKIIMKYKYHRRKSWGQFRTKFLALLWIPSPIQKNGINKESHQQTKYCSNLEVIKIYINPINSVQLQKNQAQRKMNNSMKFISLYRSWPLDVIIIWRRVFICKGGDRNRSSTALSVLMSSSTILAPFKLFDNIF